MVGKYPGFMNREFGSITYCEALVMCGISMEVHKAFNKLAQSQYESSMVLRGWKCKSVAEKRKDAKHRYDELTQEIELREGTGKGSPSPGAGYKGMG